MESDKQYSPLLNLKTGAVALEYEDNTRFAMQLWKTIWQTHKPYLHKYDSCSWKANQLL